MDVHPRALELVREFEGLRLSAYRCPADVVTIGYGHTGVAAVLGASITRAEAERLLEADLAAAAADVDRLVRVPISWNERAALVSFVFNLGASKVRRATLLRKLNAGDRRGAAAEFERWVYAGDDKLAGLVRRRAAERRLFEGEAS